MYYLTINKSEKVIKEIVKYIDLRSVWKRNKDKILKAVNCVYNVCFFFCFCTYFVYFYIIFKSLIT